MEENERLFTFIRTIRTASSEAHTIVDGGDYIGQVDLHFTEDEAHATIILSKVLEEKEIHNLVHAVDAQLVTSVLPPYNRGDFVISVFHGQELGTFCDPEPGDEFGTENGN